jgi:hypothetical protein
MAILKNCGACQQTESTQSFGPCNPCSCDCHEPMSTKDELEARATDSAVGFAIENFEEFANAVNQADDPFRLPKLLDRYAQQEAQRAGEAKVREFWDCFVDASVERNEAYPRYVAERVFRSMFPDSDL